MKWEGRGHEERNLAETALGKKSALYSNATKVYGDVHERHPIRAEAAGSQLHPLISMKRARLGCAEKLRQTMYAWTAATANAPDGPCMRLENEEPLLRPCSQTTNEN